MEQKQFEQLMQRLDSLEKQNKDIKKQLNLSKAQSEELILWVKTIAQTVGGELIERLIEIDKERIFQLN
jgi:hypothetical protein